MATIYWFKENGLFHGHVRDIGCETELDAEHKADAVIKNFEIVKNRYGGKCRITHIAISDLHMLSLEGQYNFFKTIPEQAPCSCRSATAGSTFCAICHHDLGCPVHNRSPCRKDG